MSIVRVASVKEDIPGDLADWTDIPDLDLAVGAKERWLIDYDLFARSMVGIGGIKFRLDGPPNPGMMGWLVTGNRDNIISEISEGTIYNHGPYMATTTPYAMFTSFTVPVRINLTFKNGPNPGMLKLQFAPVVAGQQVLLGRCSKMKAFMEDCF